MKWDSSSVDAYLEVTKAYGDIVKIIGKANTSANNVALHGFMTWVRPAGDAKPVNMGVVGQLSRILKMTSRPRHIAPPLPTRAAPSQLSSADIQKALHFVNQLPERRFYIFGKTIRAALHVADVAQHCLQPSGPPALLRAPRNRSS